MANKWKAIAIIFIILFLLETTVLVFFYKVGTEAIEKEQECAYNICYDYDSYFYESYDKICYCYTNHEIAYQKYLG